MSAPYESPHSRSYYILHKKLNNILPINFLYIDQITSNILANSQSTWLLQLELCYQFGS